MSSKSSVVRYPLFVYGTLQPGHGNFAMLRPDVLDIVDDVTIDGRVYFVYENFGYPVAKLDEEGTIKGTLLICNAGGLGLARATQMELGAGYEPWQVRATLKDGTLTSAFAFHYLFDPEGERIEDGDWSTTHRRVNR